MRRYNQVISKSVTLADEVHVFDLGRAVQVEQIKPVLKAPVIKRLKP